MHRLFGENTHQYFLQLENDTLLMLTIFVIFVTGEHKNTKKALKDCIRIVFSQRSEYNGNRYLISS